MVLLIFKKINVIFNFIFWFIQIIHKLRDIFKSKKVPNLKYRLCLFIISTQNPSLGETSPKCLLFPICIFISNFWFFSKFPFFGSNWNQFYPLVQIQTTFQIYLFFLLIIFPNPKYPQILYFSIFYKITQYLCITHEHKYFLDWIYMHCSISARYL